MRPAVIVLRIGPTAAPWLRARSRPALMGRVRNRPVQPVVVQMVRARVVGLMLVQVVNGARGPIDLLS